MLMRRSGRRIWVLRSLLEFGDILNPVYLCIFVCQRVSSSSSVQFMFR